MILMSLPQPNAYLLYDEHGAVGVYNRSSGNVQPVEGPARPPTPEERAVIDEYGSTHFQEDVNRATITADIAGNIDALRQSIAALSAITSAPNADVNSKPAPYIMSLARELKAVARQTLRVAKALAGDYDETDIGP